VDVQLRAITTWIVADVPVDLETLPPEYVGYFRVGIVDSVAHTFRTLKEAEGPRSRVSVAEVKYRRCPCCRAAVMPTAAFCTDCGGRVGVGTSDVRPQHRRAGTCHACWRQPGGGRHCAACGYPAQAPEQVASFAGRRLALRVRATGRMPITITGNVVAATTGRSAGFDSATRLFLELDAIEGAGLEDVDGGFSAFFEILLPEGLLHDPVSMWDGEPPPMAREVKRACCSPGHVLTLHCTSCGQRTRLFAHTAASMSPARRTRFVAHGCGCMVDPSRNSHCPDCGEAVRHVGPVEGKAARLGIGFD
jgi:hypothetical protein